MGKVPYRLARLLRESPFFRRRIDQAEQHEVDRRAVGGINVRIDEDRLRLADELLNDRVKDDRLLPITLGYR